jgi:hypothetical protein
MKRKDRSQHKEHVGRFFFLLEKNIRRPGIPDCLIPVFAKSVQSTIGEEVFDQVAKKIDRLLEFGEKKGFNYDQVLDSKPGKTIAQKF